MSATPERARDEEQDIFYGKYKPLLESFRKLIAAEEKGGGNTPDSLALQEAMIRFVEELRKVF